MLTNYTAYNDRFCMRVTNIYNASTDITNIQFEALLSIILASENRDMDTSPYIYVKRSEAFEFFNEDESRYVIFSEFEEIIYELIAKDLIYEADEHGYIYIDANVEKMVKEHWSKFQTTVFRKG